MLWFILVALILFSVAVFSAYFHAHTATGCRSVRLNRGALLLISMVSFASFYPLLIVYFRLYPVSSPNHFTLTLSTMMLALVGLLISLFPKRLVNLHTQGWRRLTRLRRCNGGDHARAQVPAVLAARRDPAFEQVILISAGGQ